MTGWLHAYVRTGAGILRLLRTFGEVRRGLTIAVVVLGAIQGLLLPAFTLATGALAGAVESGSSVTTPLVLICVLFAVQRLLDPVTYELSVILWRQVDESLTERVMRAMADPPGLAHIEDPKVLDAALQAQGALSGTTPGQAAVHLHFLIKWRLWGIASLVIIGTYRWWLVPLLVGVHALAFRFVRQHFRDVTLVMHAGTDRLRRAYYLRTLALTGDVAKETRVFGLDDWFVANYRAGWLRVMHDIWSKRRERWLQILGVAGVLAVVEGVALASVAIDAGNGRISIGAAVTVAQAIVAAAVLSDFNNSHWAINESVVALDTLEDLERTSAAAMRALGGDRDAAGLPKDSIRFVGVSFTYPGRNEPVFDGFNLEVEAGRSLAIVGENGAGKTTFVKLLARLHDPDSGSILVDGIDLRTVSPQVWRRRLAPVFQDYAQFEVPALDNVAFGALDLAGDRAGMLLAGDRAGATALVDRLPDGWDTILSREFTSGTQLSGGEWQRLALARALFAVHGGARVLILDEPTAAMDVRGEAEVYDRFLELTKGVTTIVISHRFSTVRRADRIVVIEHGRVIEDGSHDELLAAGGRYAAMYTLQAARFTAGATGG